MLVFCQLINIKFNVRKLDWQTFYIYSFLTSSRWSEGCIRLFLNTFSCPNWIPEICFIFLSVSGKLSIGAIGAIGKWSPKDLDLIYFCNILVNSVMHLHFSLPFSLKTPKFSALRAICFPFSWFSPNFPLTFQFIIILLFVWELKLYFV